MSRFDPTATASMPRGLHYLVTPDFEVGVRVGWGLNDQAANFFTNAGIGWQF